MAEISDVVAGETILVSWGNPIRDRTVQRYADNTQRDSLNPSPAVGDLAYITTTTELQIWDGSSWSVYSTRSYVDSTFVPAAGGTFTGPLTFNGINLFTAGNTFNALTTFAQRILSTSPTGPQIEIDPPASTAGSIRLSGDDVSSVDIGAAVGGPTYPQDYFTIGTELSGQNLRISSFSQVFLIFNRSTGKISVPASIDGDLNVDGVGEFRSPSDHTGLLVKAGAAAGSGGAVRIGSSQAEYFATIRGLLRDGSGNSSGDLAFDVRTSPVSSSLTNALYLDFQRPRMPQSYGWTTPNVANVVIAADGGIERSTSARRYKKKIAPLTKKLAALELNPVTYESKIIDGWRGIGFIADELAELDQRLATYNDDGEVEDFDIRGVVAVLAAKARDYGKRLERLEAR